MELVIGQGPPSAGAGRIEVVERKGLGHPDAICDVLSERFSAALSRFYLERFGRVLHHNVDKALLVGGSSEPALGGGRVTEPIHLILSGRATSSHGGVEVPIEAIARAEVEGWLRDHMRFLDPERHVEVQCLVRHGASELVGLYAGERPLCNDTSIGVGYAPRSPLEQAALDVERALNSEAVKRQHPALGEDVKVMAVRAGDRVELTVAVAMVDRFLHTVDDYRAAREAAAAVAREVVDAEEVWVNAADDLEAERLYLTVTGTSAESGDDGQVGRGNRANGLITPFRAMSLEAVAGKNPSSHVGKIYNLLAPQLAERLVAEIDPAATASVLLVSRIGHPVSDPWLCEVRLTTHDGPVGALEPAVRAIVRDGLSRIDELTRAVVEGRVPVQ